MSFKLIQTLLTEDEQLGLDLGDYVKTNLYRGSNLDLGRTSIQQPNLSRLPKESSVMESVIFNVLFKERFGIPEVRKRAVFTTTNINEARREQGDFVYQVNLAANTRIAYIPGMRASSYDSQLGSAIRRAWTGSSRPYIDFLGKMEDEISEYQNGNSQDLFDRIDDFIDNNDFKEAVYKGIEVMKNRIQEYVVETVTDNVELPPNTEIMVITYKPYLLTRV